MTVEWHRTPTGQADTSGRWVIERAYRPARRGPADRIHDGYTVRDTVGHLSRSFDTVADAKRWIGYYLRDEESAARAASEADSGVTGWASYSDGRYGLAEVYLKDGEGGRHRFALVSAVGLESNVRAVLALYGLDLQRVAP